jgi:hypothetical protein
MLDKNMSYIIGLFQTDASLSKESGNKGRLTLELSARDADILPKIASFITTKTYISSRIRNTNFKKEYVSVSLKIYDFGYREYLNKFIPYGRKSNLIKPPEEAFSEIDYVRGLIDGDGSLGFTSKNIPFVSLTTNSDFIKDYYINFIKRNFGYDIEVAKNFRDGIYNILLMREKAVELVYLLYYQNCLSIDRKSRYADLIKKYIRPLKMRKKPDFKFWKKDEDVFILKNSIQEAVQILGRSISSVSTRLWRLKKFNQHP